MLQLLLVMVLMMRQFLLEVMWYCDGGVGSDVAIEAADVV